MKKKDVGTQKRDLLTLFYSLLEERVKLIQIENCDIGKSKTLVLTPFKVLRFETEQREQLSHNRNSTELIK